jgi:hypothetical protein
MSRLEFYGRPLVAFDATNPTHRSYYYDFLKNRGWGGCPVRFICPEAQGMNLVTMIQQAMLQFYVEREFELGSRLRAKTVAKKPQKKVSQKTMKLVDAQLV